MLMGKRPVVGMVGLVWVGLALSGATGCGSTNSSTKRPQPTFSGGSGMQANNNNGSGTQFSQQSGQRMAGGTTGTGPGLTTSGPGGSQLGGTAGGTSYPGPGTSSVYGNQGVG